MFNGDAASYWLADNVYVTMAFGVAALVGTIVYFSRTNGTQNARTALLRPRRVVVCVFGALAIAALLVLQFAGRDGWLWLLAFVPTGMVLYQSLSVAIFKNKQFFDDAQQPPPAPSLTPAFLLPLMNAAWNEERRYYSTASLALRFALPALLLGAVALTAAHCLLDSGFCSEQLLVLDAAQRHKVLAGARLGLAGAYIYVVMYLGNRSFRADVTAGAALWSALTLAVGPILAAVLVYLTKPQPDDHWTGEIIPFAAGFSLRYVADVVETAIRRLLGGAAVNTSRSVPLSELRGVSKDVEQRLAEEGIENVSELAMANPNRLRRNTCYDKRQIVAWIDQALLMTYLPLAWQTLEAEGITGAIDLVWYVSKAGPQQAIGISTTPESVKKLAQRNKLDPDSLWEAMLRMHSDQQVQMNWALYQLDDRETDSSGDASDESESTNDSDTAENRG